MPDTEFSLEEIAEKNGKEGRPVYIAYKGKVYDVSGSKLWKTGSHMKRHPAGKDLTTEMGGAPHGPEMLERFPMVGILKADKVEQLEAETFFEPVFRKIPFLRRHPHPMTVHFPIAFMLSTVLFTFLYLVTGDSSFDTTAFHCLAAGVIFTPIVALTGFISWWVNYKARPMRSITIKMALSTIMMIVSVVALLWRETVPDVLTRLTGSGFVYLLLVFSLCPMILVIGWFGASLTFPIEKE